MKKSLIVFSVIILLISMSFVFAIEITGDAVTGTQDSSVRVKTSVSADDGWECDSDSDCQDTRECSDHKCVLKSGTVSADSTTTFRERVSLREGSRLGTSSVWKEVDALGGGKCFIRTQSTESGLSRLFRRG
ncbi:MAG: hypothetical protein Q8O84_00485 [Nanoarchaeota archaeon]|nr:hypothetical protein [Nanoarchaeota archaeon]